MLKNILKLDGAQEIKKNEQKTISGGFVGSSNNCTSDQDCELTGLYCPGQVRCLPFNGGVCLGRPNTFAC